MKKMVFFLFLTFSLYAHVPTNSNKNIGWTSGGGELPSTMQNPWFVQNTKDVFYCIKIDEENFGLSLDVAKREIKKAISFWKKELSTNTLPGPVMGAIVATQDFHEVSCESINVDLTFSLGVLSSYQRQLINTDPKRLIGLSFMTDYDPVNLKGKGFIYVTPERGPLKVEAEDIIDSYWSTTRYNNPVGFRLGLLLRHELGHIFGISHIVSDNSRNQVMQADLPFKLVNRSESVTSFPEIWRALSINGLTSVENNQNILTPCKFVMPSIIWAGFENYFPFLKGKMNQCFFFNFRENNQIEFSTGTKDYQEMIKIGTFKIISPQFGLSGTLPFSIALLEEQKVFLKSFNLAIQNARYFQAPIAIYQLTLDNGEIVPYVFFARQGGDYVSFIPTNDGGVSFMALTLYFHHIVIEE